MPSDSRSRTSWLARLATAAARHRWWVVIVWVVVLVTTVALGAFVVRGRFANNFGQGAGDSRAAQQLLEQRFPSRAGGLANLVFHTDDPISSPSVRARITHTIQRVTTLPHVVGVRSPFATGVQGQVAPGGHTAYAVIQFDAPAASLPKDAIVPVVDRARAEDAPGFQVELDGAPIDKAIGVDVGGGEFVGVLAAMVILLIVFGSLVAMGLPIVTALVGLGTAIGVLDLLSNSLEVPTFGPQLAAMIGLGVGIDYALFIVTRYRTALHAGSEPAIAIATAGATSGRAITLAGSTVVVSLLGMTLLGESWVYGLAFGAIAAVLLVLGAALTLLPALLGFSGRAIDRFGFRRLVHAGETGRETWWHRWSRVIQGRPWTAGAAALAVLVLLALPTFSMHQAFTDEGTLPRSLTTRRAFDLLARRFGPGTNGPLVVALDLPEGRRAVARSVATRMRTVPDVAFVAPPVLDRAGDAAVVLAVPASTPQSARTQDLVRRLRADVLPEVVGPSGVQAHVGGFTAASVDVAAQFRRRLPWVVGGVIALSFVLLMVVFRSIAVPVKAAVMNLLSIGAAYGVMVAVFQWGWAGSLVGIATTAPIDPWIPLMLFTILFGLSMDYEVFLLSRIREEWLRTGENSVAVAEGLAATGRVITAAAAIMVCVFASFVLSDLRVLKVFGLGLAVAVFVDATIVRCILVPATMELLGRANWWLPRFLERRLPPVGVEPRDPAPPARVPVDAGAPR